MDIGDMCKYAYSVRKAVCCVYNVYMFEGNNVQLKANCASALLLLFRAY